VALTITKVEPADQFGTVTGAAITNIPEPSTYVWSKHDISGQEAGRTITSDAWKNKKAEARSIRMTWNNKDGSVISQVFQAFNHEYMWVTYLDALTGQYERKHFYLAADISATIYTMYNRPQGLWSVADVELIQAVTDKTS
jgi:hypothetical protein